MPTRTDICRAIDAYVSFLGSHDVDRLVALFHEDAVQHEPLGVRSYRGIDEIRRFDTENAQMDFTVSRLSPITVVGRFAATQLKVSAQGMPDFVATDLFEFDDDCKIVSLQVLPDLQATVGGPEPA
ncbi:nuclear transport factor 2 family protein [Actinocorallia populi]|uniref:nuclear transport factor 2 family protein n=1 Tax=Actinocorallia populi TaxID=2079200 RepID=UPI000D090298|nr:nuclear transport factor 2 family protein [Actinocorallia populi]